MISSTKAVASTQTLLQAGERFWDVLVVGAGPAGTMAARELARSGVSVLVVDKAAFPRRKVCGCYVNGSALATLNSVGLPEIVDQNSGPRISSVRLGAKRHTAEVSLPQGAALSRETLDTALLKAAVESGAVFLAETEARANTALPQYRENLLIQNDRRQTVRAKITIVADGVAGQFMRGNCDEPTYRVAATSLVGAAAVSDCVPRDYRPGSIQMAIGRCGYVGCLQIENGQLDIAAAFLPETLRTSNGPGQLAQSVVDQSNLPRLEGLSTLRWLGTPRLSRAPRARAGHRFFLVGDAAGYVEPFTGEGISWALATGRAVAPLAKLAVTDYSAELERSWTRAYRKLLGRRQRLCYWLTKALRYPRLAQASVAMLSRFPGIVEPVVRMLNTAPE